MTCIVGLEHGGKVYIGGDSAGCDSSTMTQDIRADQKVFVRFGLAFGFTYSFRMGQLLRYAPLTLDVPTDPRRIDRWMTTGFIDGIRACLKAGAYHLDGGSGEMFAVGVAGRLYTISSDYQVARSTVPFAAVGCGSQVALGAMWANPSAPPKRRILSALEASERYSMGVRAPFKVVAA